MHDCASCGHGCGSCGGCDRSLTLTQPELDMLRILAQIPFLSVARTAGDETPICLEDGLPQPISPVLQVLEKKGLISLDFDCPLKNADLSRYAAYPILGSMALTVRGQQVIELLELQGCN